MSFTEIMALLLVGIVVVGPRKLPIMMRKVGQWVAKARNMSSQLRSQSGIDDLIREEGLEKEIRELRMLSRNNVLQRLIDEAGKLPTPAPSAKRALPSGGSSAAKSTDASSNDTAKALAGATSDVVAKATAAARASGGAATPESVPSSVLKPPAGTISRTVSGSRPAHAPPLAPSNPNDPPREREYPEIGCDAYGALPDDIDEAVDEELSVEAGPDEANGDATEVEQGEDTAATSEGESGGLKKDAESVAGGTLARGAS